MRIKLILFILILLSIGVSAQKKVKYSDLIAKDGLMYEKGSDEPFTGKCFRTFDNGKLGMAGSYYKGLMHGDWVWWYPSGNKKRYTQYKNGFKHGKNIYYYPNGKKKIEMIFYENKNIKQTRYDINGNIMPNPKFE